MQIKTMMGNHPCRLEWLKYKRLTRLTLGKNVEQVELSYIAVGKATLYSHLVKMFGSFLYSSTYTYYIIH